jgi:hypothetical protein
MDETPATVRTSRLPARLLALPQTNRVRTTISHRAERNGQSYARRMPYGGARNFSSQMN